MNVYRPWCTATSRACARLSFGSFGQPRQCYAFAPPASSGPEQRAMRAPIRSAGCIGLGGGRGISEASPSRPTRIPRRSERGAPICSARCSGGPGISEAPPSRPTRLPGSERPALHWAARVPPRPLNFGPHGSLGASDPRCIGRPGYLRGPSITAHTPPEGSRASHAHTLRSAQWRPWNLRGLSISAHTPAWGRSDARRHAPLAAVGGPGPLRPSMRANPPPGGASEAMRAAMRSGAMVLLH